MPLTGALTPEQQMKVLARIWGRDREGFVFLPWISGAAKNPEARRKAYHEGPAYEWPVQEAEILGFLRGHPKDDVYFSVSLFTDRRRVENQAEPERCLWADLDFADPQTFDVSIRPTVAWESSPGRYQGVWLLDRPLVGASWPGKENQRLSLALGADPSGWDTTQLLRVPGRPNHKPDHRGEDGRPKPGSLLWLDGPVYTAEDFDDLPEIELRDTTEADLFDEDLLSSVDRHAVWARCRLRVSSRVREFMSVRDPAVAESADRDQVLWQIERDLADAGCSMAEIIAVVRPTVWNKYAGRNDELRRLKTETAKALSVVRDEEPSLEEAAQAKPNPTRLSSLARAAHPRPRWLVRQVWARGSCGFISGAPKSYKSWTGMDLAVSIASGRRFLGEWMVPEAQPVLYVQEEDSIATVLDRFERVVEGRAPDMHWHGAVHMSADGRGVTWEPPSADLPLDVYVRKGFTSSDPAWQAWLAERLQEGCDMGEGRPRVPYAMIFVDTMGTTAGDVDTDRQTEVMERILRPLKQLAGAYDVAVALVHHNRKAEAGARAGAQMLGSVALHAWVEDALYVREKQALELEGRPGFAVLVERESKQGQDLRFRIEIPAMATVLGDEHDRRWRPAVTPWSDDSGGATSGSAGGAAGKAARGVSETPASTSEGNAGGARERQPRGRKMANLIRSMGPRGGDLASVVTVSGVVRQACLRQLKDAQDAGWIVLEGDRYVSTERGQA